MADGNSIGFVKEIIALSAALVPFFSHLANAYFRFRERKEFTNRASQTIKSIELLENVATSGRHHPSNLPRKKRIKHATVAIHRVYNNEMWHALNLITECSRWLPLSSHSEKALTAGSSIAAAAGVWVDIQSVPDTFGIPGIDGFWEILIVGGVSSAPFGIKKLNDHYLKLIFLVDKQRVLYEKLKRYFENYCAYHMLSGTLPTLTYYSLRIASESHGRKIDATAERLAEEMEKKLKKYTDDATHSNGSVHKVNLGPYSPSK